MPQTAGLVVLRSYESPIGRAINLKLCVRLVRVGRAEFRENQVLSTAKHIETEWKGPRRKTSDLGKNDDG